MQDMFGEYQPAAPSHLELDAARRCHAKGGSAVHHLVAHLSGGLRATYAAEPETEGLDAFEAIIARLAASEAATP
ncbi:hypothetical protein G3T14_02065 [Methylobacterium sp. BTF04]|uniref:hypothetical protein n=1 Tax=Methylobacterium sp. BTF04 TaxID=2708300 RepID=UPI0013D08117|nr:hypothetical protein [Methylobacterium sp. BTF04]NEU10916.1 hypothetical protein [Methylobacterium sp. BTF04]